MSHIAPQYAFFSRFGSNLEESSYSHVGQNLIPKLGYMIRSGAMHSMRNGLLMGLMAFLISAGLLVIIPVEAYTGAQTTGASTISSNIANVNIVSGAQNPNNGLFFSPANITVTLGVNNTVAWTNRDSTNHTVFALDNSYGGTLIPGGTFTHTFTAPGVYKYYCTIHTFMRGSVIVLGGPSTSTSSSTSATSGSYGSGIPEFPFGAVALAVVTVIVLVSYAVLRQTKRG